MASLKPEVIEERILLQLPFKSVVRWMCASRFWCRRIRSSEFSKKFLKKSIETDTDKCLLLSSISRAPTQFYTLAFDDNNDQIGPETRIHQPLHNLEMQTQVVSHCNGLICLCNHSIPSLKTDKKIFYHDLVIWNPSIGTFKKVPMLPWFGDFERDFEQDILRYPPSYGFGYNPKVDDFKIVRIGQREDLRTGIFASEVMIYSLKTNKWRQIPDLDAKYKLYKIAKGNYSAKDFSCPFLNGHMHWLMVCSLGRKVLAFDVENEEFRDYGFPSIVKPLLISLSGVGDQLYVLHSPFHWVDIWRMREQKNGGAWIRLKRLVSNSPASYTACPLLHSRTELGTLCLACTTEWYLFWLDQKRLQKTVAYRLGKKRAFRGISMVQSFLLGDGKPVPWH